MTTTETNKPVEKIKVGAVTAAVFAKQHTTKEGKEFTAYNVELTRSYTPDDGQTYKYTSSMNAANLDNAILALKGAKDWIALKEG